MLNQRIRTWSQLPPAVPANVPESWALDFKVAHKHDASEHAKDIAAFANAMGGVILVGVHEKSDSYVRNLLTLDAANRAARDYEDAARDLLSPRPQVDPTVIPYPEDPARALLAVNVEPFPGQLIGAKLPTTQAWRFPIRTAARHCAYVDPERAMIYSDPRSRKNAILLLSIPEGERKAVYVQIMDRKELTQLDSNCEVSLQPELRSVDVDVNTVVLGIWTTDRSQIVPASAPLEDVQAVWKSSNLWMIRLGGALRTYKDVDGRRRVDYMSGRGPYNWD